MTILAAELKAYYPTTISDASGNGGRISFNPVTSSALQNVFPHVFRAERLAGSTKHRKLFFRSANDADETLYAPSLRLHAPTPGEDYVYFRVGTQRNTQGDLTGSERKYGVGTLKTTVTAGGSTLVVTVENAALTGIFQNGDKIRITDMHSKKRSRAVARPRQIAMALAKELTQLSLPEIGSNFGGRDHTTVLHACRTIAALREAHSEINHDVTFLLQVLRN